MVAWLRFATAVELYLCRSGGFGDGAQSMFLAGRGAIDACRWGGGTAGQAGWGVSGDEIEEVQSIHLWPRWLEPGEHVYSQFVFSSSLYRRIAQHGVRCNEIAGSEPRPI